MPIHYETHRTSQTRLLKFSHSENDADDANDAEIDITQLSGWDISKIASQASLASSASFRFYVSRSIIVFVSSSSKLQASFHYKRDGDDDDDGVRGIG